MMLLVYGIGFVLALATGDPRTLLLRNSLITASVGVVFLVTAIRGHRLSSTVWGIGLIVEALVRIPVVYLLPVDVSVGATEALGDRDLRRPHGVERLVRASGAEAADRRASGTRNSGRNACVSGPIARA
ncbi:hypothetical protein ACL02T_33595 [Pseudonocardia sp. RS010]|uniref:hypothetical protein n=1 Tax=Pseudonocardia sp. RS010 TaxID=3385979 RepID=UPI00399F7DE6